MHCWPLTFLSLVLFVLCVIFVVVVVVYCVTKDRCPQIVCVFGTFIHSFIQVMCWCVYSCSLLYLAVGSVVLVD